MRKYATTLIIWVSLIINEMHSFWETSKEVVTVGGTSMPVQWFIWFMSNSIWSILMAAAILFYKENRINKTTVLAYLIFCVIDLVMFFYNYKQAGYQSIYTILLISWVIIYNYGCSSTTDRPGIAFKAKRGD